MFECASGSREPLVGPSWVALPRPASATNSDELGRASLRACESSSPPEANLLRGRKREPRADSGAATCSGLVGSRVAGRVFRVGPIHGRNSGERAAWCRVARLEPATVRTSATNRHGRKHTKVAFWAGSRHTAHKTAPLDTASVCMALRSSSNESSRAESSLLEASASATITMAA